MQYFACLKWSLFAGRTTQLNISHSSISIPGTIALPRERSPVSRHHYAGKSHDAFLLFICSVTDRSLTFNTQANFLVHGLSPTHPSLLQFYSLGLLGLHTNVWTQGHFSRHQATISFSVSKTQCQPFLLGYSPQRLNGCCSPLHLKSRELGLQHLPLPMWWSTADLRSHSALWCKHLSLNLCLKDLLSQGC